MFDTPTSQSLSRRAMRTAVALPRVRHAAADPVDAAPDRRSAPLVLLAEDDAEMRSLLASVLRRDGWRVAACPDAEELWRRLDACRDRSTPDSVDLVIADVELPGASGLELLRRIEAEQLGIPVVLITAFAGLETRIEASQHHVAALFSKPFPLERLRSAARAIAGRH